MFTIYAIDDSVLLLITCATTSLQARGSCWVIATWDYRFLCLHTNWHRHVLAATVLRESNKKPESVCLMRFLDRKAKSHWTLIWSICLFVPCHVHLFPSDATLQVVQVTLLSATSTRLLPTQKGVPTGLIICSKCALHKCPNCRSKNGLCSVHPYDTDMKNKRNKSDTGKKAWNCIRLAHGQYSKLFCALDPFGHCNARHVRLDSPYCPRKHHRGRDLPGD